MVIKNIFLLISFNILINNSFAQSIITGLYNDYDYYYNFIPDTTISASSYSLDINGDGIIDLFFKTDDFGGQGGGFAQIYVIPNNNTQFIFDKYDFCTNYPKILGLPENTLIDSNSLWFNKEIYLGFHEWSNDSSCSFLFSYTNQFIGTRIFVENDTLYGWIKLKDVYCMHRMTNFMIQEFACNNISNNINSVIEDSSIKIYPNPTTDYIIIDCKGKDNNLYIYNLLGEFVLQQLLSKGINDIDISNLETGIYVIKIENEQGTLQQKLIKK